MLFRSNHPNQRARQETERICTLAGFKPCSKLQTKNIQTISRLVYFGVGVSLVPESYITLFSKEFAPNYYNIEEKYKPEWNVCVSYAKNLPMTNSIESFISICTEFLPQWYKF